MSDGKLQATSHFTQAVTAINSNSPTMLFPPLVPLPPQLAEKNLPLRLWPVQESLQDGDLRLQRLQPHCQPLLHCRLVITKLHVEVLAVWARGHGSAEDGLDEEAVVGLEGRAVGVAEGDGELLGGELHVLGESNAGEVEATAGG